MAIAGSMPPPSSHHSSMSLDQSTLTLYTYFRSSCSARVRTAAILKGIGLNYVYINLLEGEQHSEAYTEINSSRTVPTLVIQREDGPNIAIQQSVAILEFFEEHFSMQRSLLPDHSDPVARAIVRQLVNIIACDVQPVTNLKLLKRVEGLGHDKLAWAKEFMSDGLRAYEKVVTHHAGKYSVGDTVTLADVALAPAVEGAIRFGVDLDTVPIIKVIYSHLTKLNAFVQADWRHQEDTPQELRTPA